jgi:hypothetical protein
VPITSEQATEWGDSPWSSREGDAIKITRKVRTRRSRKSRTETVHAVTDLPAGNARPHQLAAWLCGH